MQHFILSVLALLLLPMTILAQSRQGTGTGVPRIPTITGAPFKNTTTSAIHSATALPIPLTSKFTWTSTKTQTNIIVKIGPTASVAPSAAAPSAAAPSASHHRKRDAAREHARDF